MMCAVQAARSEMADLKQTLHDMQAQFNTAVHALVSMLPPPQQQVRDTGHISPEPVSKQEERSGDS